MAPAGQLDKHLAPVSELHDIIDELLRLVAESGAPDVEYEALRRRLLAAERNVLIRQRWRKLDYMPAGEREGIIKRESGASRATIHRALGVPTCETDSVLGLEPLCENSPT